MTERGRFSGMWAIVRYNWPIYVAALVVLGLSFFLWSTPYPWKGLVMLATFGSLWFLLGSLIVSHWVYDLSRLYRWDWLAPVATEAHLGHGVISVSGFDEVSRDLEVAFPDATFQVLDHYDEARMSEPSIHRARRHRPPPAEAIRAAFDSWPAMQTELVLAPLSVHEFRSESERTAWFTSAKEALAPGGRVVVVEHVRDLANFVAFGPGFLHFHSRASWERCWKGAGLALAEEKRLTPFVRAFVLK